MSYVHFTIFFSKCYTISLFLDTQGLVQYVQTNGSFSGMSLNISGRDVNDSNRVIGP